MRMEMWSYEAFLADGALLVARSQRLQRQRSGDNDGEKEVAKWTWRHGKRTHLPGNSYLVSLSNPRKQNSNDRGGSSNMQRRDSRVGSELDDINALLEEDDGNLSDPTASLYDDNADDTVLFDFHIVFHAVYRAPVLYFRLTRLDGSPVSFHSSSAAADLRLAGSNDRTPLVSMEDHQVLGTPFYFLHPCETASAMALLLSQPQHMPSSSSSSTQSTHSIDSIAQQQTEPTYLLAWLCLVQPLTRIDPRVY